MEVEEALQQLGFYGKWQTLVFALLHLTLRLPCNWHIVSILFIGHRPLQHCMLPQGTSKDQLLPLDLIGGVDPCTTLFNLSLHNQSTHCVDGWQYDDERLLIKKWDLVCGQTVLSCASQLLFTIGLIVGGFVFQKPVRMFGSKRTYTITAASLAILGLLSVLLHRLELFLFVRVLLGIFTGGTIYCESLYLSTCFSQKSRDFYFFMECLLWGPGIAITTLLAFSLANWAYLQICIDFYLLASLPFHIWWLPETVPWLYEKQKVRKAEEVLLYAGAFNGVTFQRPIFKYEQPPAQDLELQTFSTSKSPHKKGLFDRSYDSFGKSYKGFFSKDDDTTATKQPLIQYSLLELLRNPYLLRHMLVAAVLFVHMFSYFSVFMSSWVLPTNHYLNILLFCLVDVVAVPIMHHSCKRFGKTKCVIFCQALAVILMFALALTQFYADEHENTAVTILALSVLFEFFTGASWFATLPLVAELFPTPLRESALLVCLGVGRMGTMLASFSPVFLVMDAKALYIALGCSNSIAEIFLLFLPNTHHKSLPDTIEDIITWYEPPASNPRDAYANKDGVEDDEVGDDDGDGDEDDDDGDSDGVVCELFDD